MTYFITTAIAYVNGEPHLGHAYEAIATDVLARHQRQRGEDVFFLTGADEHGEPIADAARAAGVEPQALADEHTAQFIEMCRRLNVSNDFYIRTTDERHKRKVQEVLQRVHANGYVYKGLYEGWYCPRCADFKTDSEILEGNLCPVHEIPLTRESEENWFFKLSAFQEPIERLFAEHPDFVMPGRALREARAFLEQGLQDVSLSRGELTWGVAVPWDPDHVFYVWFDALLNYYTALSFAREGEDLTDRYWPASLHVIGKDIFKFHTIFWPAMLLAADLPVPRSVFVHGFLMGADGRKMAKSLGNGIDPYEAIEAFGVDALRFYLLRDVVFGSDGNVGMDALATRYESELANEYGNLASRTIAMLLRYRDGAVPAGVEVDPEIAGELAGLPEAVRERFDRVEPTQALELIWQRVRRLNRYVEERAPWVLAREPERAGDLDVTLATLYEGLLAVTIELQPFIPESTHKLLQAIAGRKVSAVDPLFPKR